MNNELSTKDIYRQAVKTLRGHKIKTPELDARVLIEHVLELDDANFILRQNNHLNQNDIVKVDNLIFRRAQNEPIAYITGHKEFFGLDFKVDKNVLIPRPESEWLAEQAIKMLSVIGYSLSVLDVGTGSGNIVVAIAKAAPQHRYFAIDNSLKALKIAKKNARALLGHSDPPVGREESINARSFVADAPQDDMIKFFQSDLFSNKSIKNKKFDLIIANLPYVPKNSDQTTDYGLQPNFEPRDAIFADDNGSSVIKRFLIEAKNYLTPSGAIFLELDPRNSLDIKNFARNLYPDFEIELKKDLANLNRYLILSSRV